jgi:hypothetical protein
MKDGTATRGVLRLAREVWLIMLPAIRGACRL